MKPKLTERLPHGRQEVNVSLLAEFILADFHLQILKKSARINSHTLIDE